MRMNIGIVIRADGKVPFDPPEFDEDGRHVGGLHPDHKRAIIGHLVETGHTLEHAEDGAHVVIVDGPLKPAAA